MAWGDYDNDGDLDLAFGGASDGGPVLRIARNEGGGALTEIDPGLSAVTYGTLAWADYDNDGDIDLAWAGTTSGSSNGAITRIGRNNGDGTFTQINAGLP